MSVSEAFRGVVDASVESMALASCINASNLQPRCRICHHRRAARRRCERGHGLPIAVVQRLGHCARDASRWRHRHRCAVTGERLDDQAVRVVNAIRPRPDLSA